MMRAFKSDRHYLLRYCLKSILVFGAANLLLLSYGPSGTWGWSAADALLPVAALLLCGLPSSVLHNCAHENFRPRWLNQALGELCGTIMLYGFRGFALGHVFHHRYPDDPRYDPHPPAGQSFTRFVAAPVRQTLRVIATAYTENYGRSAAVSANLRWQTSLFHLSVLLKLGFWLLLLGPKLFALFYLPLYVANIFVFAHINFATHVTRADGRTEIINLNEGWYYRLVNAVSFGGYFHKNHHRHPKVFNPSTIEDTTPPMVSRLASPTWTTPQRERA